MSHLESTDVQLARVPTRPLWQQVLTYGEGVERRLAVSDSLIAAGHAHETIWDIDLSGDALANLVDHEDWRLQVVDDDGTVVAERTLKDRSRAEIESEQRSQIEWLVRAAGASAEYCTQSTPDSREANEMSVI